MNKGKQLIYTILGIIFVGILFCAAILFPQYYNMFYDNKTLNRITYMDVSFRMYETPYESFQQKLQTIAYCYSKGITLHAVKVNETEDEMNNEKLTDIVKKEWNTLMEKNVLVKEGEISGDNLSSREMYTIYTTSEEKSIKGINYWKLTYEGEDYSVTVVLDTEYHKIYDILVKSNILFEKERKNVKSDFGVDKKCMVEKYIADDGNETAVDGNEAATSSVMALDINDVMEDKILGNDDSIIYMEGMVTYYGLEEYGWYFWDKMQNISHNFRGVVEFENAILLDVGQRLEIDEYGYGCWSEGVDLEKKIQF